MKYKTKAATVSRAANEKARPNYSIRQRIKFALVLLAAHGLLPYSFAEYLITRGGLRHE